MTDSKPIYRFLPKKRSELPPPTPTPAPAPTSTPPTEQPPTEQSEIRLERVDTSMPATESVGHSGWEAAQLLKEWRLDWFT